MACLSPLRPRGLLSTLAPTAFSRHLRVDVTCSSPLPPHPLHQVPTSSAAVDNGLSYIPAPRLSASHVWPEGVGQLSRTAALLSALATALPASPSSAMHSVNDPIMLAGSQQLHALGIGAILSIAAHFACVLEQPHLTAPAVMQAADMLAALVAQNGVSPCNTVSYGIQRLPVKVEAGSGMFEADTGRPGLGRFDTSLQPERKVNLLLGTPRSLGLLFTY